MSNLAVRLKESGNRASQMPIMDWFFCLFLLVSFFNVRKVLYFHPILGMFNEYLGGYLYLADIALMLMLLTGAQRILYNKNIIKSSIKQTVVSEYISTNSTSKRNVRHCLRFFRPVWSVLLVNIRKHNSSQNIALIGLILAFASWCFASLFWVCDLSVGFYRAIRLLELISLAIYIAYQIVPRGTIVSEVESKNVPRGTFISLRAKVKIKLVVKFLRGALLGLLFVALFDHYLWDIWVGQILFWLLIGFLLGFQILLSQFNSTTDRAEIVPRGTIMNKTEVEYVPRGTYLNKNGLLAGCFWLIILIGAINALVAIAQFLAQHSIGVRIMGESIIGTNISGVAKLVIGENIVLRAYGLMPHPNILGGLLLVSILMTILGLKMVQKDLLGWIRSRSGKKLFHAEHSQESISRLGLYFRQLISSLFFLFVKRRVLVGSKEVGENVPRGTSVGNQYAQDRIETRILTNDSQKMYIFASFGLLILQMIALLLTFSKSAIGGLIVALVYIYVSNKRTTGNFSGMMKKMFHVEHFPDRFFVYGGLVGFVCLAGVLWGKFIWFSIEERLVGFFFSIETIFTHSLFGVGIGQFVPELWRTHPDLPVWQYQPVHNLFLLVWSELGVVGLVLFLMLLGKVLFMNK